MHGTSARTAVVGVVAALGSALLAVTAADGAGAVTAQVDQCGTDLSTRPAAPSLSVAPTAVPATGPSTVTVSGGRYLTGLYDCAKQRFGGVYLFFGWVQPGGQWGPSWRTSTSMTGHYGTTYSYPGEGGGAETRDDGSGTVRLVSFSAGGTSGTETPFHMDADGNWAATVTVPGPVFSWRNEVTGATNQVDCRQVQCGVFTIGAHGVASRPNELFSPITFASGSAGGGAATPNAPAGTSTGTGTTGGTGTGAPRTGGGTGAAPSAPGGAAAPTRRITPSASTPGGAATTTVPVSVAPATELAPDASTTVVTAAPTTTTTLDRARAEEAAERAGVRIFDEDEGGGAPVGAIAAGVGGAALLAAGATVAVRRRRSGGA